MNFSNGWYRLGLGMYSSNSRQILQNEDAAIAAVKLILKGTPTNIELIYFKLYNRITMILRCIT